MEKIGNSNKHLGAEERAMIMLMKRDGSGVRETARFLKRSPSTISRELGRDLEGTLHRWQASRLVSVDSSSARR